MKINNSDITQSSFLNILKEQKSQNMLLYFNWKPINSEVLVKELNGKTVQIYTIQEPLSESFTQRIYTMCKNKITMSLSEFMTLYDQQDDKPVDPQTKFYPQLIKEWLLLPTYDITPKQLKREKVLLPIVLSQKKNFFQLTTIFTDILYKESNKRNKEYILFRAEFISF